MTTLTRPRYRVEDRRWYSRHMAPSELVLRATIDQERTASLRGWWEHRHGHGVTLHFSGIVAEAPDHWGRVYHRRLCGTCRDYAEEVHRLSELSRLGL